MLGATNIEDSSEHWTQKRAKNWKQQAFDSASYPGTCCTTPWGAGEVALSNEDVKDHDW